MILNTKVTFLRNKTLFVEEYIDKAYLKDINNLKKSGKGKIQLTIANSFICSIDNDEEFVIHSKSDNIEIMIMIKTGKVIEELFKSLKNRYQKNLKTKKSSEFSLIMFIYCIINTIK